MTLKDAQEKYADALKVEFTVAKSVLYNNNLYKNDTLIEYCSKLFSGSTILYCKISGYKITCISSEEAYEEEARQRSMIVGTKVRMTGDEGRFPENQKDWIVTHEPRMMCGSLVVWLDGYSGAYSCDCLEIVEEKEDTNEKI